MTFRIAQDYEYRGNNYWNWRAWIEGDRSPLSQIASVRWLLHPSFSPSVVMRDDPATRFLLETSGWGTFVLRAELHLAAGGTLTLRHNLQLEYPDEAPESSSRKQPAPARGAAPRSAPEKMPGPPPRFEPNAVAPPKPATTKKVYLSYGSADRRRAKALREALEKLGISVLDDSQIAPGAPFELALLDMLSSADATVAYVSSSIPSAFVAQEINASHSAGKPTLVVTDQELGPIAGVSDEIVVKQFDLNEIATTLHDLKIT